VIVINGNEFITVTSIGFRWFIATGKSVNDSSYKSIQTIHKMLSMMYLQAVR